jgi:hypothetical protein
MTITSLVFAFAAGALLCGLIDVDHEHLLTLAQLARRLPRRRCDRPVHVATLHRWRRPGLRGIRLECVRVGGVWCTTMQAFQRFCDRLSIADTAPTGTLPNSEGQETPSLTVISKTASIASTVSDRLS